MTSWKNLTSIHDLDSLIWVSSRVPIGIYKHSADCALSALVSSRLEMQWDIPEHELAVFSLDVLAHGELSREVERRLGVRHDAPQMILLRGGRAVYNASSADVSVREIKRALDTGSRTGDVAYAGRSS